MSDFYVGQKVVCVDDSPSSGHRAFHINMPICRGTIYIIRWVGMCPEGLPGVKLEGIKRLYTLPSPDSPFRSARFRPLEEKKSDISIFREIARGVSDGKPIIEDAEWRAPTPEKVKA